MSSIQNVRAFEDSVYIVLKPTTLDMCPVAFRNHHQDPKKRIFKGTFQICGADDLVLQYNTKGQPTKIRPVEPDGKLAAITEAYAAPQELLESVDIKHPWLESWIGTSDFLPLDLFPEKEDLRYKQWLSKTTAFFSRVGIHGLQAGPFATLKYEKFEDWSAFTVFHPEKYSEFFAYTAGRVPTVSWFATNNDGKSNRLNFLPIHKGVKNATGMHPGVTGIDHTPDYKQLVRLEYTVTNDDGDTEALVERVRAGKLKKQDKIIAKSILIIPNPWYQERPESQDTEEA